MTKPYLVFLDWETTGLEFWRGEPIQGYFYLTDASYNFIGDLEVLVKPDNWDYSAEKVHGIEYTTALSYPEKIDACRLILDWFREHGLRHNFALVMHANPTRYFDDKRKMWNQAWFDWSVMNTLFASQNLAYDRKIEIGHHNYITIEQGLYSFFNAVEHSTILTLWSHLKGLEKKTLDFAAKQIGYEFKHHNAKDDVMALVECWKFYTKNKIKDLKQPNMFV